MKRSVLLLPMLLLVFRAPVQVVRLYTIAGALFMPLLAILFRPLALLPFAILTNALGFWVVRRTPEALFFRITLILMFAISIVLIRSAVIELLFA